MGNKSLFNQGLAYLLNGQVKQLLCGIIFLAISKKNLCYDVIGFQKARFANQGMSSLDILVNGNLMNIDLNDTGISRELYVHGKREFYSTEFIKHFLSPDETVIDIGANIGYYALMECDLACHGMVYAVEPVPSNIAQLIHNIKLNKKTNINTFELALSDSDNEQDMYIYSKCNWCSLTKNENGELINTIKVESMTLDRFIEIYVQGSPSFIRMDVEGHEYEILKGGLKLIKSENPLKFFIEVHPHLMSDGKLNELLDLLRTNNFLIKAVILEPSSFNFKDISIFNKLREVMNEPTFGFKEASFEHLIMLFEKYKCCLMVFLERTKV